MAKLGRIEELFQLLDKLDEGDRLSCDARVQLSDAYGYFKRRFPRYHTHDRHIAKMHKRMEGDPFFDVDFYGDYEISDGGM